MADEDTNAGPRPRAALSENLTDESEEESLTDFIYEENMQILERRGKDIEELNQKAGNLTRLLGVIFTLYSSASLVAARLALGGGSGSGSGSSASVAPSVFINEYTVLSLFFLAAAFLYSVLAYHRTEVARGPSADFLQNEISREMSVKSAKRTINREVPEWVTNNETEVSLDHSRLFNAEICVFISLSYLVIGTLFATDLNAMGLLSFERLGVALLVGGISYLTYDYLRDRAWATADEESSYLLFLRSLWSQLTNRFDDEESDEESDGGSEGDADSPDGASNPPEET